MKQWPPREIFPDRHRPHRLPPEEYQRVGQPVFFATCTDDRRAILLQRGLPGALAILLDQSASACDCDIIAYTIMPDHIHVLACVVREGGDVLSFFKEFKRSAALAAMRRGFPRLWQRDFWDRHTRNSHDLKRCVTYVLWNPVEEGLCEDAHDWPWTEFRDWPWALVEQAASGGEGTLGG